MHGVLVYGYVGTGYGGVGYKTMLRRTLNYQRNLGISGVFFDHVPGARKELAPYARLALRLHTAGLRVAINPEQNDLPADVAGSFDEIVLLESGSTRAPAPGRAATAPYSYWQPVVGSGPIEERPDAAARRALGPCPQEGRADLTTQGYSGRART